MWTNVCWHGVCGAHGCGTTVVHLCALVCKHQAVRARVLAEARKREAEAEERRARAAADAAAEAEALEKLKRDLKVGGVCDCGSVCEGGGRGEDVVFCAFVRWFLPALVCVVLVDWGAVRCGEVRCAR
jgi:hypothetical protein